MSSPPPHPPACANEDVGSAARVYVITQIAEAEADLRAALSEIPVVGSQIGPHVVDSDQYRQADILTLTASMRNETILALRPRVDALRRQRDGWLIKAAELDDLDAANAALDSGANPNRPTPKLTASKEAGRTA